MKKILKTRTDIEIFGYHLEQHSIHLPANVIMQVEMTSREFENLIDESNPNIKQNNPNAVNAFEYTTAGGIKLMIINKK